MRMEVVNVTPAMAEQWLAAAAGYPQRAITKSRVNNYASAMTRGQWKVTHQAIAIDPDGANIDGQHRLTAVIVSGQTVPMTIAYDVPREVFPVIDTGQARTAASTLHIAGVADASATAAAVRMMLAYDKVAGTRLQMHSDIRSSPTSTDILDFMASPRGVILSEALPVARSLASSFSRYGMRSWLASAVALVDETNPNIQLRTEFVDKLHSGAMLAESSPVLTYRRWLLSDTGYLRADRSNRGITGVAAYIKAWNAWLYGRPLSLMRIRPGRELWPMPGRDLTDDDGGADALADPALASVG